MVTSIVIIDAIGGVSEIDDEDSDGDDVECQQKVAEALGAPAAAVVERVDIGPQALKPVAIRRCYARIHYSAQIAA